MEGETEAEFSRKGTEQSKEQITKTIRHHTSWQDPRNKGSPAKACGLSIDSRKSKQEEFSVNDTSKLRPELFDFSIERFCCSIG